MSEKGHAKNLENGKKLRDFAVSWGLRFNPAQERLKLANLNAVIAASTVSDDAVEAAEIPYRNATGLAKDKFAGLSKLITRVMDTLEISGVSPSVYEDAQTYARKIKGERKGDKPVDDPTTPDINEADNAHSVSQMSRTNRVENLDSLILLLKSQSLYQTNKLDLQTDSLEDYSSELKSIIQATVTAFVPLSNAWVARDDDFYTDQIGLVDVCEDIKTYVKTEMEEADYEQIKDLKFEKIERRKK